MATLADIHADFPQWYQDVLEQAELVDHGPTRGSMIIRPYGYAIWELMVAEVDRRIKAHGVQNAYFPLLIPKEFISREAKHIEGFSPELAVVTYAGGKELDEPLVIRPTSETIIYYMFSKWIKSYRDLPLKINQWANVVRWEMRTRPFLRTTEILWQEGHTAHHTRDEAFEMARAMHQEYTNFLKEFIALPVIMGDKSESERFAGADVTLTMEAMMPDGKALQMGTSHVLSQSFSKAFNIEYQGPDGELSSPYCTSWAVTTRMIGAAVMVHGDEKGLVLPPKIAPYQVVIVPIFREDSKARVMDKVRSIKAEFKAAGIRIHVDDDERRRPGAKFFYWEMRGVPIRMEIGPKDIEKNQAVLATRILWDGIEKKNFVPLDGLAARCSDLLSTLQDELLSRATRKRDENWHQGGDLTSICLELEKQSGFYQAGWCGSLECEEKLKECKATIRCIIPQHKHKCCFACTGDSGQDVIIAKAY